jgi:RNA polymerase sporulation-specific sigma factor
MKVLCKSTTYERVKDFYSGMTDEELIIELRKNNSYAEECLLKRYVSVSKKIISSFYLIGADVDDLLQEAMIALFKAIKEYKHNMDCSFRCYAITCIKRYVISVIRRNSRKKHSPLNNYISFSNTVNEDNELYMIEKISNDIISDPESIVVSKERENIVTYMLENNLSKFEKRVLSCYFLGLSYSESSTALNTDAKAIDNALQRIRKKIRNELKAVYY